MSEPRSDRYILANKKLTSHESSPVDVPYLIKNIYILIEVGDTQEVVREHSFPSLLHIQRTFCYWLEVRMGVGRLTHRLCLTLSWLSRAGCSDRMSEQSLLSVDTASLGV